MMKLVPFLMLLLVGSLALAADVDTDAERVDAGGASPHHIDPGDMSQVPRLTRKTLFRAVSKAKRGEHEDAVALLDEYLADFPDQDHFLVRYHLGSSHDALGRDEDARAEYARAVEMEPRLDAAWFGLGHVEYTLGNYASSGAAFHRAFRVALDPRPETLYFAAAGYMLAEDHETAAPLLRELCSGNWGVPRHDWYAQLASCAIELQRPELARGPLDRYLATHPDSHEAWFLQYQFEVGFKQYREAAVALTLVGYLRELTPREQRTLGDLYSMVEVPALASARYRQALAGQDAVRAEDYERLVSALVAAHDLDEALRALQEGLQTAPTTRLWSLLGDIHYMRKDYAAAAAAFARWVEQDPKAGRPWLMIGYCHIELGNRGLAIQHLVQAARFEDQEDLAARLLQRARKMDRA